MNKDEESIDSVFYWKRRHNEAVDKWVKLDSLVLKIMRENDALKAAVAAEREACARVCEQFDAENPYIGQGRACAFEIRERGEV